MILDASPTEAVRWAAVLDRDAAADGRFVYAVASTRIYCRRARRTELLQSRLKEGV
jgi:AraC family transcriptional regulator of adaptative response/methylated-DNA-[protein]-cysteine methyltransferase